MLQNTKYAPSLRSAAMPWPLCILLSPVLEGVAAGKATLHSLYCPVPYNLALLVERWPLSMIWILNALHRLTIECLLSTSECWGLLRASKSPGSCLQSWSYLHFLCFLASMVCCILLHQNLPTMVDWHFWNHEQNNSFSHCTVFAGLPHDAEPL